MKFTKKLVAAMLLVGAALFVGCTDDADVDTGSKVTLSVSGYDDNVVPFTELGGVLTITMDTNQDIWTIKFSLEEVDWCTVAECEDEDQIAISVAANTGDARSAILTVTAGRDPDIATLEVVISQEMYDAPATIALSDSSIVGLLYKVAGGSESVTLVANKDESTFAVSSSETWCTPTLDGTSLSIAVSESTIDDARAANVIVTAGEGSNTATLQIGVTQAGLLYDPADYPHDELAAYTPSALLLYTPSKRTTYYNPILVSTASDPDKTWSNANTRVLEYLSDFTPNYSAEAYQARTNKYGSDLTQYVEATGRFYTYKDPATGRWWIIDPEGYRHIQRGLNTVKSDNGADGVWETLWSDIPTYLKQTREEFAELGIHGSGAFSSSGYYQYIQNYNALYPDAPLTIAPSMGWLSAFKSKYGYAYPTADKSDDYCKLCFAWYPEWEEFCTEYATTALASYKDDPNVFGFFSDNELQFTSANYYLLDEAWYETDNTMPAKAAAIAVIESYGYTEAEIEESIKNGNRSILQGEMNLEYVKQTAELYFGGISRGAKAYDPGIMYLGSRFHGTPKYLEAAVHAAGKYCDIISINYYTAYSPELTTYVDMWEQADAPFMISEFYIKGTDQGHGNSEGAGECVTTQAERGFWYQHFTLGLLESSSCVGWHWFRYMDDQDDVDGTNRGFYNNKFEQYTDLTKYARELNYNTYDIIEYFDAR